MTCHHGKGRRPRNRGRWEPTGHGAALPVETPFIAQRVTGWAIRAELSLEEAFHRGRGGAYYLSFCFPSLLFHAIE